MANTIILKMNSLHAFSVTTAINSSLPRWQACLLAVIACTAVPCAESSPRTIKCIELQQTHVYLNKIRILLSPQAVRLEGTGKFRFVVIAHAPKWQVTAFRADDKYSYSQTLNEFCDQGLYSHMVLPQRPNLLPPVASKSIERLSGLSITRLRWQSVELKILDNAAYAPQQTVKFLHSALRIPTQMRIPVSFEQELSGRDWMTNVSQEGLKREFLNTKAIAIKDFPSSEFEVPKGLRPAKSMTRVVAGDARKMEETGVDQIILQ